MVFKVRTLVLAEPRGEEDLLAIRGQVRRFSLRQLKQATNGFSKKNIVGKGGYGVVYRGHLPEDGSMVAVKRLVNVHKTDDHQAYGEKQFRAEVELGGLIAEHPNLLRLRGYCITKKERILVYPFIGNGNLHALLFDRSNPLLDWSMRKKIALGVAKAIAYLNHGHDSDHIVIHRDIKPSNVLLGHDFEPVLCDFGIAKIVAKNPYTTNSTWARSTFLEEVEEEDDPGFQFDDSSISPDRTVCIGGGLTRCWNLTRTMVISEEDSNHRSENPRIEQGSTAASAVIVGSRHWQDSWAQIEEQASIDFSHVSISKVCGTIGYLDPECSRTMNCSIKNDVYGYGITLLELITGQKGMDHFRQIFHSTNNELHMLVDPRMIASYYEDEVWQMIQVARLCIQESSKVRPKMSEVVQMLEEVIGHYHMADPDVFAALAFDRGHLFGSAPSILEQHSYEFESNGSFTDSATFQIDDPQQEVTNPPHPLPADSNQDTTIVSSKGKEVASPSLPMKPADQQTIFGSNDLIREAKIHERWRVFLWDVVSDGLPTKSKLWKSGVSVDPLCPLCNQHDEDSFHLFFTCDFSKQVWQLAAWGIRIDLLGFVSVQEAVDMILKPNDRVVPRDLEESHFSSMCVAVMYSLWSCRNKAFFDKVTPNVRDAVSSSLNLFSKHLVMYCL